MQEILGSNTHKQTGRGVRLIMVNSSPCNIQTEQTSGHIGIQPHQKNTLPLSKHRKLNTQGKNYPNTHTDPSLSGNPSKHMATGEKMTAVKPATHTREFPSIHLWLVHANLMATKLAKAEVCAGTGILPKFPL